MSNHVRDSVLDAAESIIDENGEAALRLATVAERAGVTVGAITHHFGDREGLVVAAHVRRFGRAGRIDVRRIEEGIASSNGRAVFERVLAEVTADVVSSARLDQRMRRLTVIAACHHRPILRAELEAELATLHRDFARVIDVAKQAGFVRPEVDAEATASFVQAYALGMVVVDLNPEAPASKRVARVIESFLSTVLVDAV